MPFRRFVISIACAATGVLSVVAPASGAIGDVQTPTITGPIANTATSHPFQATDIDLSKYGYTEDEYYLEGNAFTYDTSVPLTTAAKITTGGPLNDGLHPYKTRITVRRPINPADYNGTTVVEWNNVTAQFDLEANWFGDPFYLLKHGYVWVGVSAQGVGVNALKGWNPDRYGSLNVNDSGAVTGDALSYEIYSAAIKALRGQGNGPNPLAGLNPQTVIASGESQSGSRLSIYYNAIQPLHEVVDAFLLTVSNGAVRTDRPEKVMRVVSETENQKTLPETDTNTLRHWEVAAGSHLPELAYKNFTVPVERDLPLFAPLVANCDKTPLSRVQWPYVVNSAIDGLVKWTHGGAAPPTAPRGIYSAPNTLTRNSLGIAEGAIRLPEVTTPVAVNTGSNVATPGGALFSLFCPLLGSNTILPQGTINGLYSDFGDYTSKVKAAAETVSGQGFVLPEDASRLVAEARKFPQIRPTTPVFKSRKRTRGALKLSWIGTGAPATKFQLQHARATSKSWSKIPRASALAKQAFSFSNGSPDKDGTWRYRVRSITNVPATPIAAAYVVTTPWSDAGTRAIVDGTKPKLKIICPKKVKLGSRAFARIKASDAGTGLRKKPKSKVRIRTGKLGRTTIRQTVSDRVGNKSRGRCVVRVIPR